MISRARLSVAVALGIVSCLAVLVRSRTTFGTNTDVFISSQTTFAALDGSSEDADGVRDGVFTVAGDLTLTKRGAVTCNDDPPLSADEGACAIHLAVGGSLILESGSELVSENRRGGGNSGNITIDVAADLRLEGSHPGSQAARISASKTSAQTAGGAGDVTIHAGGSVVAAKDSQIVADADGDAGEIQIIGGTVSIAGSVSSSSAHGDRRIGRGGPILIRALCDLIVTDDAVISSYGEGLGADLVTLEGCTVTINGHVGSTGFGTSDDQNRCGDPRFVGCIAINADRLTIDATNQHRGEVVADTGFSDADEGRGRISLSAAADLTILGSESRFAAHSNQRKRNGYGGLIDAISSNGRITLSGLVFQADSASSGGTGGEISLRAERVINLSNATLAARGDFNAAGGFGRGGEIRMDANAPLSWSGIGDVRPTGTDVNADQRGSVFLAACDQLSVTASFPSIGARTSPVNYQPFFGNCYDHPPESEGCCGPPPPPSATPRPTETPDLTMTRTPTTTSTNTPTHTPNRIIFFGVRSTPTPTPTPRTPFERSDSP